MRRTRLFVAIAAAGLIATGALATVSPADSGALTNALLPLQGASGGGSASVQVDWRAKKVCYAVEPTGLSGALSGAIVKGSTPVVTLKAGRNGELAGCVDAAPDVAKAIIANPTDYALSINNGALTARLSSINNFK